MKSRIYNFTSLYADALRPAMCIGGFFFYNIGQCFSKLTDCLSKATNLNYQKLINLTPGNAIKGATGHLNSYTDLNVGLSKRCSMIAKEVNKEKPLLLRFKIKYFYF